MSTDDSQKNSNTQDPSNALPQTGTSEILGLVELLKSKGGREDIYKLAAELSMEFGDTLTVIKGAELLGLVHTPGGDVVLEKLGEKIVKSKINKRKTIVYDQLLKIPLFKKVYEFLKEKESFEATKEEVLEKLAELIPNEDAEKSFQSLVGWGRYAELFGYNDDDEIFYIDPDGQANKQQGLSN